MGAKMVKNNNSRDKSFKIEFMINWLQKQQQYNLEFWWIIFVLNKTTYKIDQKFRTNNLIENRWINLISYTTSDLKIAYKHSPYRERESERERKQNSI